MSPMSPMSGNRLKAEEAWAGPVEWTIRSHGSLQRIDFLQRGPGGDWYKVDPRQVPSTVTLRVNDEHVSSSLACEVADRLRGRRLDLSPGDRLSIEVATSTPGERERTWLLPVLEPPAPSQDSPSRAAVTRQARVQQLVAEVVHLKHGPGGSGLRGACDPDCRKCAIDRELGELRRGEHTPLPGETVYAQTADADGVGPDVGPEVLHRLLEGRGTPS